MELDTVLNQIEVDPDSKDPPRIQKALHLARILQERASGLQTHEEAHQQEELDRLIREPHDKATLAQITDQAFRSERPERAVKQLIHILDVQGIPGFFSPVDQALLSGLKTFGTYLPTVTAALVREKMQHETANVILPSEPKILKKHLNDRRSHGLRMNLNYLGEALLGESEARRRLTKYLEALRMPEIEVISVKISTIYSQINPLARRDTLEVLTDRMELLYRAAARERFIRADGTEVPKFVYLDMEEYRDMSITAEVFMNALSRDGLEDINAGIALQAYIPDSFGIQQRINQWARQRVASGGDPVTIRIVKGANLEMERLEASVRGWPQAPFRSKLETDANYKRMLHEGMKEENACAVSLGIASHNLFELAYAIVLAAELNLSDRIQFEMLEGMANHQRRALFELTRNVLLYAPACGQDEFIHAIGYLVRRLDENTGRDNFLRHAFKISPDSEVWKRLEETFRRSFSLIDQLPAEPRRTQNRREEQFVVTEPVRLSDFTNEPDTDFSLPHNSTWAEEILDDARVRFSSPVEVPFVIGGDVVHDSRFAIRDSTDPSTSDVVAHYCEANPEDVERAVINAGAAASRWRATSLDERSGILHQAAMNLRKARGRLIGTALAEGGKLVAECDGEVSEAVDFTDYYVACVREFCNSRYVPLNPLGVVAVVTPWNFPIAIPCGGIAAALATGNCVILKPAPETVLTAYDLCTCFWDAGVSREALQFVPCSDVAGAPALVSHPGVDAVIFTGGTVTARSILQRSPETRLFAETGGKNATIVTALSDRDQAIKHVIKSAFSHSGQKCSATSLLVLEDEVYHDSDFKNSLIDAVSSLKVGSAWDLATTVGPLIRRPEGALVRGLKELEPGESWALLPERKSYSDNLWSPAIKWGVQPGNFTHMTELFGPVLGVMCAGNLERAVELVNQTGYGLTSGLESLDEREQEVWKESVRAGNLYINRPTTGAIVHRQPFGGMGKSSIGPGIKAGGPNYVTLFSHIQDTGSSFDDEEMSNVIEDPELHELHWRLHDLIRSPKKFPREDYQRTMAAIASYDQAYRTEFSQLHDDFRLIGQDNIHRYLPIKQVRIRVNDEDSLFDIFGRVCGAYLVGCRVLISSSVDGGRSVDQHVDVVMKMSESWDRHIQVIAESDDDLASEIRLGLQDRIRYAAPERVPAIIKHAASDMGQYIACARVLQDGRLELLHYVQEQSISHDYHRYGNPGFRSEEARAEPL